jgi:hypothetical protein
MTEKKELLDSLTHEERRKILLRNWMSHDGHWFRHVVEEFGPEAANKLNMRTCRSIGRTDWFRLVKALRIDKVRSLEHFLEIFKAAWQLYAPPHIDVDITIKGNRITAQVKKCFAYEGVKSIGIEKIYDCGIFERIRSWLDAAGVKYELEPPIGKCLKAQGKKCKRTIALHI